MVDILPLGSGSVDPHIFADSDPDLGRQNRADPTDPDPDPKHWVFEFTPPVSLNGIRCSFK